MSELESGTHIEGMYMPLTNTLILIRNKAEWGT